MPHAIKAILWDIDGTLLNFSAAEKAAIRACFRRFDLGECTDDMLRDYSDINVGYWRRIERGEIEKSRALVARFEDFFTEAGLPVACAAAFNDEYQLRLGDTVVFNHGAYDTVVSLRPYVKQYAVTNGTRTAQRRKLQNSGLIDLLDGVFISDEIGAEKPDAAFFDHVFRHIDTPRAQTVIIGDSITSDMRGGNNAGIRCCWYNPEQRPRGDWVAEGGRDRFVPWSDLRIDNELRDIADIQALWAHELCRPERTEKGGPN